VRERTLDSDGLGFKKQAVADYLARPLCLQQLMIHFFPGAARVKDSIPNNKLTIIKNGPIYVDWAMPEKFTRVLLA